MAKKDNFEFDTETKTKSVFDFSFFKNLTKKQKETILIVAIAVVAVVLIVVIGLLVISGTAGDGIFGNGSILDGGGSTASNEITNIYVSTPPHKTTYSIGSEIDYSGLSIVVNKASFRSETVYYDDNPKDFKFSGFDSSSAMYNQVITVTYKGHSTTFKIDIKPDPDDILHIISVELISIPKTEYRVGDIPSFSGGKIMCTYSDGTTYTTDLTFGLTTGFEQAIPYGEYTISIPGEYTITVEYWDGGYCATTSYTITVTE